VGDLGRSEATGIAGGHDLPRPPKSLPPRFVDTVLLVWAFLAYAGFLFSVVWFHGPNGHVVFGPPVWTPKAIVAAVCIPTVASLWWRRQYPTQVLAIALATLLIAYPYPFIFALIALFTAVSRTRFRTALIEWLVAAACITIGKATTPGSWGTPFTAIGSALLGTGLATAVGMYVGARRAYLERLKERALFARALASFLPSEVADMVQASPEALSLDEEVEATILFSDIRGFSTLAETLPPREVAQLVGRHLEAMAQVVSEHAGTLDKFAGDAVMAVFGVPRRIDDHADRAIRCAVAMQRRQQALNAEATELHVPTCEIGVGVNSGMVIAGTIGGPGRLDYTVIGDAVNVAQRLQAEAAAGEILVSAATADRSSHPQLEDAGTRTLKGRSQPVPTYRVLWSDNASLRPITRPTDDAGFKNRKAQEFSPP
jgi:class 3 adenylate cyclase